MPESPGIKIEESFPEKYKPTQCLFYVDNASKSYQERIKPLSRVNKLWNHIKKIHRDELTAFTAGHKLCPIYETRDLIFTPSGIRHFKSHTQKVHKIKLRP